MKVVVRILVGIVLTLAVFNVCMLLADKKLGMTSDESVGFGIAATTIIVFLYNKLTKQQP